MSYFIQEALDIYKNAHIMLTSEYLSENVSHAIEVLSTENNEQIQKDLGIAQGAYNFLKMTYINIF